MCLDKIFMGKSILQGMTLCLFFYANHAICLHKNVLFTQDLLKFSYLVKAVFENLAVFENV